MRRQLISVVAGCLLIIGTASGAVAKTEKIPVSGVSTIVGVESPGTTTWNGSVQSVRGMILHEQNVTDNPRTTGLDRNVVNFDLDMATGRGKIWGWGVHAPAAYPAGTWTCTFAGTFVDYAWTGKGVCHATGELRGWQWRADLTGIEAGSMNAGYIFLPGH